MKPIRILSLARELRARLIGARRLGFVVDAGWIATESTKDGRYRAVAGRISFDDAIVLGRKRRDHRGARRDAVGALRVPWDDYLYVAMGYDGALKHVNDTPGRERFGLGTPAQIRAETCYRLGKRLRAWHDGISIRVEAPAWKSVAA